MEKNARRARCVPSQRPSVTTPLADDILALADAPPLASPPADAPPLATVPAAAPQTMTEAEGEGAEGEEGTDQGTPEGAEES